MSIENPEKHNEVNHRQEALEKQELVKSGKSFGAMEIEMDKIESTSVDNFKRMNGSVLNFNSISDGRK